jgi:hypothetical protein
MLFSFSKTVQAPWAARVTVLSANFTDFDIGQKSPGWYRMSCASDRLGKSG